MYAGRGSNSDTYTSTHQLQIIVVWYIIIKKWFPFISLSSKNNREQLRKSSSHMTHLQWELELWYGDVVYVGLVDMATLHNVCVDIHFQIILIFTSINWPYELANKMWPRWSHLLQTRQNYDILRYPPLLIPVINYTCTYLVGSHMDGPTWPSVPWTAEPENTWTHVWNSTNLIEKMRMTGWWQNCSRNNDLSLEYRELKFSFESLEEKLSKLI